MLLVYSPLQRDSKHFTSLMHFNTITCSTYYKLLHIKKVKIRHQFQITKQVSRTSLDLNVQALDKKLTSYLWNIPNVFWLWETNFRCGDQILGSLWNHELLPYIAKKVLDGSNQVVLSVKEKNAKTPSEVGECWKQTSIRRCPKWIFWRSFRFMHLDLSLYST